MGEGPVDRQPADQRARAESVATKAAYKRAFVKRRAIVPADGFYEWQKLADKKQKQPWFIRRRDGEPLAFAGLWEIWHDPAIGDDAPRLRTFTIITTEANELLQPIHERMPVVLPESEWDRWLDPGYQDVDALQQLLVPAPDDEFEVWPVGKAVNKVDNNGPAAARPRRGVSLMEYTRAHRRHPHRRRAPSRRPRARRVSTRRSPRARTGRWPISLSHVGRIHRWVTD